MPLPNAPACERNREPILAALLPHLVPAVAALKRRCECLEVGSGTGQHAAWFTNHFASDDADPVLRNLYWQPSELEANLSGVERWRIHNGVAQMLPAQALDLRSASWLQARYDFFYTANTLHIVSWPLVEVLCAGVVRSLRENGLAFIYGPFSYHGVQTSEGNQRFDSDLRARDPRSGIRDCDAVLALLQHAAQAQQARIELREDKSMPANNRLLVLQLQR
ncbi:MAG: DUF938 domain-containing protein [Gammaproteobacteria bacterium]|nr:DUF938 domain-containing protein [Gammaproteobacteria bacterium]